MLPPKRKGRLCDLASYLVCKLAMRISIVERDLKQRAKAVIVALTSEPATTYLTDSQVLAVIAKSKTSLI